jgi:hypothetical protein
MEDGIMYPTMTECQHHPRALINNLRQPMPLWHKLRLLLGNTLIKIKTRRSCCGHYGQPGC